VTKVHDTEKDIEDFTIDSLDKFTIAKMDMEGAETT
jgi:hypothetical protein